LQPLYFLFACPALAHKLNTLRILSICSLARFPILKRQELPTDFEKIPGRSNTFWNGAGKSQYNLFLCPVYMPVRSYGVWSAEIPTDWPGIHEDMQSDCYPKLVANASFDVGVIWCFGVLVAFFHFGRFRNQSVMEIRHYIRLITYIQWATLKD